MRDTEEGSTKAVWRVPLGRARYVFLVILVTLINGYVRKKMLTRYIFERVVSL